MTAPSPDALLSASPFRIRFWTPAPALCLVAALAGCLGPDKKDKNPDPDPGPTPGYTCLENDPLCIPRDSLIAMGETLFMDVGCAGCHGEDARGGSSFPPLANSDFFMEIRLRPVSILFEGLTGPITVNGQEYNGFMPNLGTGLSNAEVAAILTWLRAVKNDSTVVSCTPEGCVKTARSAAEIAVDSIAVWEVKHIRDSLGVE